MGLGDIDPYDRGLAAAIAAGSVEFEIISEGPDHPAPYYTEQWRQLFTSPDYSPRHWAWLASAVQNADHVLLPPGASHSDSPQRGGEQWCAQAYESYHHLRSAGAYAYLPERTDRCVADWTTINTWLNAPAPHGPAGSTVADALDVHRQFDGSGHIAAAALESELSAAQDVGVFGLAGHRIELHLRDALTSPPLALVTRPVLDDPDRQADGAPTSRPGLGSGVVSDGVYLVNLLNPQGRGTSNAVLFLTTAAIYVNQSLDFADVTPDRAQHRQRGDDLGVRPRPFPALTVGPTTGAARPAPRPDGGPEPGRHR